jgi:hypothetical protein
MKMPEQKTQTFRGAIQNVKNVNTRSGRKMITFEMTGCPFKAFGEQAEAVEQLEGEHVEITAKHNTFHGKDEYAVVTIAGGIDGQRVTGSDTHGSALASSSQTQVPAPQQNLKPGDRDHWRLPSYGNNVKARKVGVWLKEFFDSLTDDEWRKWQMPMYERFGTFPATEEEVETRRTWRDTSASPPRLPQDLDSVKARFNSRLDLVREDLRHQATAESSEQTSSAQEMSADG